MGPPVGRHVWCLPRSLATVELARQHEEGTCDGWDPDLESLPDTRGRRPGIAGERRQHPRPASGTSAVDVAERSGADQRHDRNSGRRRLHRRRPLAHAGGGRTAPALSHFGPCFRLLTCISDSGAQIPVICAPPQRINGTRWSRGPGARSRTSFWGHRRSSRMHRRVSGSQAEPSAMPNGPRFGKDGSRGRTFGSATLLTGSVGLCLVAGANDSGFVREDDGLDAVTQAELRENLCDMSLDGGVGEHEHFRDLAV